MVNSAKWMTALLSGTFSNDQHSGPEPESIANISFSRCSRGNGEWQDGECWDDVDLPQTKTVCCNSTITTTLSQMFLLIATFYVTN